MITKKEIVEIIKETIQRKLNITVGGGHRSFDIHLLTGWHYASRPEDMYGYIALDNNHMEDTSKIMLIDKIVRDIFERYQYNVIWVWMKKYDNGDFRLLYHFRNQELEAKNA